jgi:hypothetical protein
MLLDVGASGRHRLLDTKNTKQAKLTKEIDLNERGVSDHP